uniref:snRNA-activating protein complex subunit 1 n=1 Tax=Clytia hemisphaerica TaxID=252671 RepID=A0A7M5XJA7_9CNID|eukprot:TCONS_00063657-protein
MAYFLSTEFEALKHDVNKLFSKFHEKQSVRFDDFCEEWKKLNFSALFGATYRNTPGSKMRIAERLFRIASEFLSEDSTFLYRVAAIYTFYAVYFKQVTPVKTKIRMTPAMWTDLMQFTEVLKKHSHYDVVYIIHVLRKSKAFCFTAFPKELFFGKIEFMLGVEGISGFKHSQERSEYLTEILDDERIVPKLQAIQNDYAAIKEKLIAESQENEREDLSKVLFYINQDFPEDVSTMINSYKRKYDDSMTTYQSNDEATQRPVLTQLRKIKETTTAPTTTIITDSDSQAEDETRASKIFKLKEKLWSSNIQVDKSKGYEIKKEKKKLSALEESIAEKEREKEDKRHYYKKSAMLQVKSKVPGSKSKSKHPYIRFELPTQADVYEH